MLELIFDLQQKTSTKKLILKKLCALSTSSIPVQGRIWFRFNSDSAHCGPFLTTPVDFATPLAHFPMLSLNDRVTVIKPILADSGITTLDYTSGIKDIEAVNSQPNICSVSVTSDDNIIHQSLAPPYDWIEEEMAKVCGVEMEKGRDSIAFKPAPSLNEKRENVQLLVPLTEPIRLTAAPQIPTAAVGPDLPLNDEKAVHHWRIIRIKNEADLEKKLKRIVETKGEEARVEMERRFNELFGPNDESTTIVTSKDKIAEKMREETAALTVKHLMPIYKKQKIASRELFKKLAKHITKCILEKCTYPDSEDVRVCVQKFFHDGRSVECEADIYSRVE